MSVRAIRNERATSPEHTRAGLVSRVLADVCDVAILVIAIQALLLLGAVVRYLWLGPPFDVRSLPLALETSAASAAAVSYLAYFWAATGRTPGKQLLGLRVVHGDERRLSGGRAVLRAALCVAFPIGLLWSAVSRRNASLQDLVLRTAVLYDRAIRSGGP